MSSVKVNDVIQVKKDVSKWGGCLLIVDDILNNGNVLAILPTIKSKRNKGNIYVTFSADQYDVIGIASYRPTFN